MLTVYLRAEIRPDERRAAITPQTASQLISLGIKVNVESSLQRVYSDELYEQVGCSIVDKGSWREASSECIIVGFKEPEYLSSYTHKHLCYGHCFKQQPTAKKYLDAFTQGGGVLFDYEFMVDNNNEQVFTTSNWAGVAAVVYMCMVLGKSQQQEIAPINIMGEDWEKRKQSLELWHDENNLQPSIGVIGAKGKSGVAVIETLEALGFKNITAYHKNQNTDFSSLKNHDAVFICITSNNETKPLITVEDLEQHSNLKYIIDITCEPHKVVTAYNECNSFMEPFSIVNGKYIVAIDNLPSLFAKACSEQFSHVLMKELINLNNQQDPNGVWKSGLARFKKAVEATPS